MPSHGCDRGTRGLLLLPLLLAAAAASALLPLILLLRSCCCCLEQLLAVQHLLLQLQNGRPINPLIMCCYLALEVQDALLLLLMLLLQLLLQLLHGCCYGS